MEQHVNKQNRWKDIVAGGILAGLALTLVMPALAARTPSAADYIGAEKAEEIALEHAGAEDAAVHKAKLDWDDGRAEYEVEFRYGDTKYDYDIDALTGAVLSWDVEHKDDDHDHDHHRPVQAAGTATAASDGYIGWDRVKELVRAQAGITGGTFHDLELDWDDGRAVYEGELKSGGMEYEFELDAVTGAVLDWDADWDD